MASQTIEIEGSGKCQKRERAIPEYLHQIEIMVEAIAPEMGDAVERTRDPFNRWFILTSGAILAITGIAKVWSAFGSSKFLAVIDPIFGVTFGKLMLVVGVAELVIALVCFLSKRQTLALGLVAWMSTNFVVYRLGLWWMDWHRPCNCLGNLTDALHISPQSADNIMKVLLAYLLIGSYGLLIWHQRKRSLGFKTEFLSRSNGRLTSK